MLETSFHIHRDEVTRTLIGCPPMAERQKYDLIPFAMERHLRHNGRWEWQRRNGFFHVSNVILQLLRNSYGIYVMATAERQRNDGTRHNSGKLVGYKSPKKDLFNGR